jgi:hypothetical protein
MWGEARTHSQYCCCLRSRFTTASTAQRSVIFWDTLELQRQAAGSEECTSFNAGSLSRAGELVKKYPLPFWEATGRVSRQRPAVGFLHVSLFSILHGYHISGGRHIARNQRSESERRGMLPITKVFERSRRVFCIGNAIFCSLLKTTAARDHINVRGHAWVANTGGHELGTAMWWEGSGRQHWTGTWFSIDHCI